MKKVLAVFTLLAVLTGLLPGFCQLAVAKGKAQKPAVNSSKKDTGKKTPAVPAETKNEKKTDDKSKYDASAKGLIYAADVLSVKGPVLRVKRVSSPHWMKGRPNMPNYVSDVLETDNDSVACIEFLNGSQLGINKNTKVEIISTAGAKDITSRGTVEKVILRSGTIWAKVTGQKEKTFSVETSKGVLGVKGTEFVVESDPKKDEEKVTVLEGSVQFDQTGGKSMDIEPGQEVTYSKGTDVQVARKSIDDIRSALNGRFPGLNPKEQAIISVFTSHLGISGLSGAHRALNIASQSMSLIDNPESYLKDRAMSEVNRHSPVSIPGGIFGGGRKKEPEKPKALENLQPNGDTIDNYYPKFCWPQYKDADKYRFMVTREPLKKGVENPGYYAFAEIKETEILYPDTARALKPGYTYYWTVAPLDKEGKPMAPFSEPASFTMADYQTLGVKGLFPSGIIEAPAEAMTFDWTPVAEVKGYKVEIADNSEFNSPVFVQETQLNYITVENAPTLFQKGKEYFWRAVPMEGESGQSNMIGAVNSFKIAEK